MFFNTTPSITKAIRLVNKATKELEAVSDYGQTVVSMKQDQVAQLTDDIQEAQYNISEARKLLTSLHGLFA